MWCLYNINGFKVFFLESNFVNRKSYQKHQDIDSFILVTYLTVYNYFYLEPRTAKGETPRVVLNSSKTLLWPSIVVILLCETAWMDQDMWSNSETLVWLGPCTTRITTGLDEKVRF